MDPRDLRKWLDARRLAAAREREERRGRPPTPGESFARAMSLIALAAETHGWPVKPSPEELEEDRRMYRDWARLRAAMLDDPARLEAFDEMVRRTNP
jgi:hypothetical protein